jgi:dsRNA-specific ribonuclease
MFVIQIIHELERLKRQQQQMTQQEQQQQQLQHQPPPQPQYKLIQERVSLDKYEKFVLKFG